MGEAYICRRGAASAGRAAVSGYAVVCVKYPAGSDCVCTKGSESFTLENGTGAAAFAVTGSGTWTVTISNGTQSKSGSVSVSAGEIKTLQLSYSAQPAGGGSGELLSAQDGLASGYSLGGNGGMSGNAILEHDGGGFWLSPAVDLSGYESLTVSGVLRSVSYGPSRICVGSSTAKVYDITQTPERSANWSLTVNAAYSVTLDVSALNGAYYIGSTSVGNNLEITGITLS